LLCIYIDENNAIYPKLLRYRAKEKVTVKCNEVYVTNWYFTSVNGITTKIRNHTEKRMLTIQSIRARHTGTYVCCGLQRDGNKFKSSAHIVIIGKYFRNLEYNNLASYIPVANIIVSYSY